MGSIPSTLVIFNLRYFSQFSTLQSKKPSTKKTVKGKLVVPSQKSLTFTSIKKWRKFIKRRRKLLKPLLKVKSNISLSQNLKSIPTSWKHYTRVSLRTRRAVFKTTKLPKSLNRTLTSSQIDETTTIFSPKSKSSRKFNMSQFAKFHFNLKRYVFTHKGKKRLKRQRYLGIQKALPLKQPTTKINRFMWKEFKRRVGLKNSPKFLRAIYFLKKRKAFLRTSLITPSSLGQVSRNLSGSGPVYAYQRSNKVRLSGLAQVFNLLRHRRSTRFHIRIPKWQTCYHLRKSTHKAYHKFWMKSRLEKKSHFTRALPGYQSHTLSSNTFRKNTLKSTKSQKPQVLSSSCDYLVALTSTIAHSSDLQNYVNLHQYKTPNNSFTDSITSLSVKNYNVQLGLVLNSSRGELPKNSITYSESLTTLSVKPVSYLQPTTLPTQSSSELLPSILSVWLLEKNFIFSKNTANKQTVNVLSRVPSYKMNLYAPVSADRFRGNIHGRLGIVNLTKSLTRYVPSFLAKLNHFHFVDGVKRKSKLMSYAALQSKISLKVNIRKSLTGSTNQLDNFFYLKNKTFRLLDSFLKRRFAKASVLIRVKKIIKNKKLRKKYAIKRTMRLNAANPRSRFTSNHLIARGIGRREKVARKRRLQKLKMILRVKSFRSAFSREQKTNIRRARLLKDILYFSHKKLRNNCKSLKEFKDLNHNRKRWLMKVNSPNTVVQNHLHNNYFVIQKPKNFTQTFKSENAEDATKLKFNSIQTTVCKYKAVYSNPQLVIASVLNITLLKAGLLNSSSDFSTFDTKALQHSFVMGFSNKTQFNNLIPDVSLRKVISKTVLNSFKNNFFQENVISWYHNTMIRFIEDCSGKKVIFQFYPFMSQDVTADFIVRYKRWLPRMVFYERRLGHRFFLEEAIHVIHLSFFLKDPKIICSWLKAMILRISFWKTRSIFRFLKYLFFNYFQYVFKDVGIKGLKIRLKGKISAAGNSRKRTILYRIGKTSHSTTSLRVLNESTTINTFTGVMGFNVWLFY